MITSESHKSHKNTKSKGQIDHFTSETLIRVSSSYVQGHGLAACTTSAGDTVVSRLSSSSFARPMQGLQAPGKIARQPMLVASRGPPRDLSDGKGDKGGGTHGIQKFEPRKGGSIEARSCQHRKLLLQQVQLNLWVRFLWMSTFRPPKREISISPCGWEDLVSFGLSSGA
jgi:hypothetical protein